MSLTVYKASAGSGKTFTLAAEYIKYLIEDPNKYKHILAVTFTNKATTEMKERIIYYLNDIATGSPKEQGFFDKIKDYKDIQSLKITEEDIRDRAKRALSYILHDYSRFRIETIDSFFQSVVRELAHELDLTANLHVDLNDKEVLSDAVDSIIEDITYSNEILSIISHFIEDRTENGDNWHFGNDLAKFGENIFNEKYLQLTNQAREAIGNTTFLKEYKKKIQEIHDDAINLLKNTGNEFISICNQHNYTAENFCYKTGGIYGFFVKLSKGIFELGSRVQTCYDDPNAWSKDGNVLDLVNDCLHPMLVNIVDNAKSINTLINSSDVIIKHINHLMLLKVINNKVRLLNEEANRFLLAETAYFLQQIIDQNDIPFIYERMGARFDHIMIDEFQDTSSLQWKNFQPLLANSLDANNGCLIVGDVKQSIYRWRNSDWAILNNINNYRNDVDLKNLDTNFRSVGNIINFNNMFFKSAIERVYDSIKKHFNYEASEILNAYSDVAQNVAPYNENMGLVRINAISTVKEKDSTEEKSYSLVTFETIARTIKELIDNGVTLEEITILVRQNKHIPSICEYFSHNKDIIDVDIISNEAFRLDFSVSINMIIMALQFLADKDNKFALTNLAYNYKKEVLKNIDSKELNQLFTSKKEEIIAILPKEFEEKLEELSFLPLIELVEQIYKLLHLDKIEKQDAYLFYFHDKLVAYCEDNKTDLYSFLNYWDENLCSQTIPNNSAEGIRIMSVHKSKGLAFPTVIMPFCDFEMYKSGDLLWCEPNIEPFNELQLAPIAFSKKLNDSIFKNDYIEESLKCAVDNVNILYVGFTRSENNLIIISDYEKMYPNNNKNEGLKPNNVANLICETIEHLDSNIFTIEKGDSKTMSWNYGEILSNKKKNEIKESRKNTHSSEKNLSKIERTEDNNNINVKFHYFDTMVDFRQSNNSTRFVNNSNDSDISFIDTGLLYHSVLEHVESSTDINNAIDIAIEKVDFLGCFNNNTQKEEVRSNLRKAFKNSMVQEWFTPNWEVFNERTIIFKNKNNTVMDRRPDRVIVTPDKHQAIVIDYKTGAEHEYKYKRQVSEYIQLLNQMGYQSVKGYVWYVLDDKIEEIV